MTSALLLRWEPSCPPANQPAEFKTILEHSEQINSKFISTCEIQMVCVKVKAHSFWGIRERAASGVGAPSESGHTMKNLRSCGGVGVSRETSRWKCPPKRNRSPPWGFQQGAVWCVDSIFIQRNAHPRLFHGPPHRREHWLGANSYLFQLRRLRRCGLME